jgi:hypothetical protein
LNFYFKEGIAKKLAIWSLAGLVMLGAMGPRVMAQKVSLTDYKTQLEAALGGKIVGVQKTTRYPASSLTQVLNFTVDRGGGRTDVVPVQVVFVKSGDGYAVQSMYVISTSSAMAIQRTTQLPKPEPTTPTGSGGGTGTTTPSSSKPEQCKDECFKNPMGSPIDWAKAAACYYACLLGLPFVFK